MPDTNMDSEQTVSNVVKIDEERIKGHLDRIVRVTVEETLNGLLDVEAGRLVGADRYARIDEWRSAPIEGDHPYIYLDGIVMKRMWASEVHMSLCWSRSASTPIATVIVSAFAKERGLKGVELIT